MKTTINCGKLDWDGTGRKVNSAELELELKQNEDGAWCFSCCGSVWNRKHTDLVAGGQCLDDMFKHKEMKPWSEIYDLWLKFHPNDLTAGSPLQEEAVRAWKAEGNRYDYDEACKMLESKGLLTDESYLHDGKPYRYGTAWLTREIPETEVEKIKSWIQGKAA